MSGSIRTRNYPEHVARTVSLPAISFGSYGYPVDRAARIAIDAVRDVLATEPGSIERVTFVLFSQETYKAFNEHFQSSA